MASAFDPSAILAQFTANYLKLPLSQKILFPLLIVGSIWGIVFVSHWATKPDYVVLYSDLDPADASAVVESLKSQNIKYEIRGDGGTVAIYPPELVHELRLTMAAQGVPKGGSVGLELFDTTSLGTTGFVEKLKFIRATQGELERTISSLEAVSSARVHITQPEKTVFAKKDREPTASVMLRLRAGGELEKKQIKGIAHLVAGSVEGLTVENVSIIDVYGNLLSDKIRESEDALGADATRLTYKKQVERNYIQQIETMLSKVLGPGNVIARVTAELDFSMSEREEESYDPGGQVARSKKTIEEGSTSQSRGGVPGVVSNIAEATGTVDAEENEGMRRKESITNFEVSRAISKTSSPRGRLLRLSVAVLVDSNSTKGEGAADTSAESKALDDETLARIEEVVKSAVGLDISRGDTLTVESIPFHEANDTFAEALDEKAQQDLIFNAISRGVPVLFILLFFLMVVRPLIRFLITPTESELDLSRLLPKGIQELEQELKQEQKATVPVAEAAIDIEQLEVLMAENSRVVKDNPAQAALLIRYWLNDGRV
ncbi:MAG: flagellar M-ring protein FliF [Deltaproteobacteria bacterium]|nr:flagellar M-ring protein FliF [Deltaproteobacteria bacterium]